MTLSCFQFANSHWWRPRQALLDAVQARGESRRLVQVVLAMLWNLTLAD